MKEIERDFGSVFEHRWSRPIIGATVGSVALGGLAVEPVQAAEYDHGRKFSARELREAARQDGFDGVTGIRRLGPNRLLATFKFPDESCKWDKVEVRVQQITSHEHDEMYRFPWDDEKSSGNSYNQIGTQVQNKQQLEQIWGPNPCLAKNEKDYPTN